MTERQINLTLKKIEKCAKEGSLLEAVFRSSHLNVALLRFLVSKVSGGEVNNEGRPKQMIRLLLQRSLIDPAVKSVISRASLKTIRKWIKHRDFYFKGSRESYPKNTRLFLHECGQVFGLLKISVNKLHGKT